MDVKAESGVKREFVQAIKDLMGELESGVNRRNAYINRRFEVVDGYGIMQGLRIKPGFDATQYNYLPRVLEIHKSQLMGRMFQVVSDYHKEDLSVYELGVTDQKQADTEKEKARLRNARKAGDAQVRNLTIKNIMRDNDDEAFWSRAADICGRAGFVVIKHWKDKKGKVYKLSVLESPQNYWRHWTNSNFREADADMYTYQMSLSKARRDYSDKLGEGEEFALAHPDYPYNRAVNVQDLANSQQKNVWVCDFTGFVPGFAPDGNGGIKKVDLGKEKECSALIVGDIIVQILSDNLPQYEVINNLEVPGDPWGKSDISDELIQINQTLIQTMSNYATAARKVTFPKLKFKGFVDLELPRFNDSEAQAFALGEDQDIEAINMPDTLREFPGLINQQMDSFVRISKISRVMFDDPTINTASNQGLMTSMKSLIDVTEDKQKRWSLGIRNIFTSALKTVADMDPALEEAINQQDWKLQVKWPSVLRREDASYQQMYLNRWNSGTISPESYLEAMGDDASEEIDRIRDTLTDPVRAGMMARMLQPVANAAINKMLGIPPWGYVIPKVQLRGDLAPSEVGNIAHNYQWDQGPYGDTVGPQGMEGTMANQDFINAGMFNGEPRNGGTPAYQHAGQPASGDFGQGSAPNPVLTPDQNTGQGVVSQPGSGATGVSAQGAINQMQQQGR